MPRVVGYGAAGAAAATALSQAGTVGAYVALVICVVGGSLIGWYVATHWRRRD